MRDFVISVVSFFVWVMLIISTVVGFGLGSASGHGVLGAVAGFAIGCFSAGFWFLLTGIYEKLSVLAQVAAELRAQPDRSNSRGFKTDHASQSPDQGSKWTGQPLK